MSASGEGNVKRALDVLAHAARGPQAPQPSPSPKDYGALVSAAPLQVRGLLDQALMVDDPESSLDRLLDCGALQAILPEVAALVGFGDGEWRHKDVWKHTKQVVRQSVPRIEVRWAALLHDVGKVRTRTIGDDGQVHFFGHAELGARMFDRLERRLKIFSNEPELRSSIRFLILHHLRANQYEPTWTDSAVRRFAREMGGQLENLLRLAQADITTKRPQKKQRGLRQIEELSRRITELAALDAIIPPLPSGVGNAIMDAFGLPPSRRIGEIKQSLDQAVEKGEAPPHQPAEFYVDFLKKNRERFGL